MNADCEIARRIAASGVVAVLVIDDESAAVPLARTLLSGGVSAMELTLRTPAALGALRAIRAEVPEMLAGIGTVLAPEQVRAARDAGAQFAVSPGVDRAVLATAQAARLPFAPGVMTPTDIGAALEFGCEVLKFFPAGSSGGLAHLRNIAAPFAHLGLRYIPLGGVNEKNLADYLRDPNVAAVGGSWLAPRDAIAAGDWESILAAAREAAELRLAAREGCMFEIE